ncbi:sensor histidine kinase [Streptomyces erythrochromogenes]|uniref:sensor histidine kinase n=1 Tax=Streptomyces erythrochromogenes TaxID=285574 RepID=UPI003432C124
MTERTNHPQGGDGRDTGHPGSPPGGRRTDRVRAGLRRTLRPGTDEPSAMNGHGAISDLLATYQLRALQRQGVLRLGLVFAGTAEFLLFPPAVNAAASYTVLALYAVYAVVVLAFSWNDATPRHVEWAVPVVDLPVLAVLLTLPGGYSDPDWNNPFTSDWLLMVVIMSAFQLRSLVTAVTGVLATAFYAVMSTVGHLQDGSFHYTFGHTLTIALVSLAAVFLSRIQQGRVRRIADLAHGRASMLAITMSIMERDRRDLAETLHDGPLQNVLAARLDVDEASEAGPSEALRRADEVLQDAARQLRSSVTELHPSVLDQAGLRQALDDLAAKWAERGKFTVEVNCNVSSAGPETDRLLYNCAREFLTNVVKHARARHVEVRFEVDAAEVRLSVSDDGVGLPPKLLEERVAQGHIGMASQQLRLEEAGGTLTVTANVPTGTRVEVRLPRGPGQRAAAGPEGAGAA